MTLIFSALASAAAYREESARDFFTAGCVLAYSDANCQSTAVTKQGDTCVAGGSLVKGWTATVAGTEAGAMVCAPVLNTTPVDCYDLCRQQGNIGGICLSQDVNCQGTYVTSGYCFCDS